MVKNNQRDYNSAVVSNVRPDNPQWLDELISKGKFLEIHYPKLKINKGQCLIAGHDKINRIDISNCMKFGNSYKIAMFRDGPFLPSREGGSNRVYNLIKHLYLDGEEVCAIHCYRGWSNYKMIMKENFTTILLNPEDYYNSRYVYNIIKAMNIKIVDFDYPEVVLTLGSYLKSKGLLISYNAQNVISVLLSDLGLCRRTIRLNTRYEKSACIISDIVYCCSNKDKNQLKKLNDSRDKYVVVPNGVDIELLKFNSKYNPNTLFFIGNLFYEPNEIGLREFIFNVMPYVIFNNPKTRLIVIGDAPPRLIEELSKINNIKFVGPKDDLNSITSSGGIGIAYITIGSGTRLKLLNYFGLGLPSVATSIAVEGLHISNWNNVLLSDSFLGFAARIKKLQEDKELYKKVSKNARKLVESKYAWSMSTKILGKEYRRKIDIAGV